MKSKLYLPALFAVLSLPGAVMAQVNPAFSDIAEATEQARAIAQTQRKLVVSNNLALTAAEGNAFWPVYDRYAAELKRAGDRRVKVITDYAANYDNMSDAIAKHLIADSFKYQEQILKIRKSYLGKFRRVLPEVKLARFYQIENKLDAITNFALARNIPLLPMAGTDRPIKPPNP